MKKYLFALTLLAVPFTVQAQEPQRQMPGAIVQEAIQSFANPWCETGYLGLVNNVRNCFLTTDKERPEMDKCMLGHVALIAFTKLLQEQSLQTGEKDPTANIEFVSKQATDIRGKNALFAKQYQNLDVKQYFFDGTLILEKAILNQSRKCSNN